MSSRALPARSPNTSAPFTSKHAQAIWESALARARDDSVAATESELWDYLRKRHLLESWELCAFGALDRNCSLPGVSRDWYAHGYRVVVPLYGLAGCIANVQVRTIRGIEPKVKVPFGSTLKGTLFADGRGLKVLRDPNSSSSPVLMGERSLHVLVPAALEKLARTHRDSVFVRGGVLVRVLKGDTSDSGGIQRGGAPRIACLPDEILRCALGQAVQWIRLVADSQGRSKPKETWAPPSLVKAIRDWGEWPGLRHLAGVVAALTLRPDGSVLDVPGYDDATGLIYSPSQNYPKVPDHPTEADVIAAWRALREPWIEFPYETGTDGPDAASHVAYLLTIAARPAIQGPVPHWAFTAPVARTGKTLLAQTSAVAMTGALPDTLSPVGGRRSEAEAETRKRITTLVREGTRVALVDNQPDGSTYESPCLAAAITTQEWTDRVLGANERVLLPHRLVWAVSGNNILLAEDLAGRSLSIHLDARIEEPGLHRRFLLADLEGFVRREHPRLLCAALTILRGFVVAGFPGHGKPALGGFAAWDALVRGAVIWASELEGHRADPVETQTRLQGESPDKREIGALLRAIAEVFGVGNPRKARDIIAASAERADLRDALLAIAAGRDGQVSVQRLGLELRKARGRVNAGLCLEECGTSGGSQTWTVRRVADSAAGRVDGGPGGLGGPVRGGTHAREKEEGPSEGQEQGTLHQSSNSTYSTREPVGVAAGELEADALVFAHLDGLDAEAVP